MPGSVDLLGGVMLAALVFYALTGGADYGGGVWDLLASGKTRDRQRELIARAMGPIWEANHVWLILVVTVLFTGFPKAFAAISTALHVPLLLLLVGVILRGAAFTFRAYDTRGDAVQKRWGMLFSISSAVAPVLLGVIVGALASGNLRGDAANGWVRPWAGRWPFLVGLFTLVLFSYLAAVYLCVEAHEDRDAKKGARTLTAPFRARALLSWMAVSLLAIFLFFEARISAPVVAAGLTRSWFSIPLIGLTIGCSIGALHGVVSHRYRLARLFAAAQVALIVICWAASQYPWIVVPDVSLHGTAAPYATRMLLLGAMAAGSVLLFPSLWLLYRSFKGEHPFSAREPGEPEG